MFCNAQLIIKDREGRERYYNGVYFIRRVGDSLTACVTTSPPVSAIRALSAGESNYFITSDSNELDIDPSILLDHWLRELDSANMVGANWIFKLGNFHSKFKSISRTLKAPLVIQTTVLPVEESINDARWET